MIQDTYLKLAALVCVEVAHGAPILYAKRSQCLEAADSGWQFLCGSAAENASLAQVWAIHEVLERDNSIVPYISLPAGTVLSRESEDVEWTVRFES